MSKSTKIIAGLSAVAMLGVAAMPMAGAFATVTVDPDTANVNIKYTLDGTLALSIDENALADDIEIGTPNTDLSSTLTVEGNSSYALAVSGATTYLDNKKGDTIPAIASAASTLSAGEWGYKVGTVPTGAVNVKGATNFNAVTTTGETIVTHDLATPIADGGEDTVVTYGVNAKTNQTAGVYEDTLTYTLSAVSN